MPRKVAPGMPGRHAPLLRSPTNATHQKKETNTNTHNKRGISRQFARCLCVNKVNWTRHPSATWLREYTSHPVRTFLRYAHTCNDTCACTT